MLTAWEPKALPPMWDDTTEKGVKAEVRVKPYMRGGKPDLGIQYQPKVEDERDVHG